MSEKESLFREKSMEQFTAPEQLNDYIRIMQPSVIMALIAVIAFLAGLIAWGYFGSIDSHVNVKAAASSGNLTAYVPYRDAGDLTLHSVISVGESDYDIRSITNPAEAADILTAEQLELYGISGQDTVVGVTATASDLSDGVYDALVVIARLRPIDLIFGK